MEVDITNYGGIVISILVPDNKGEFKDVVLGFDKLDGYMNNKPYFGALIGRFANRIENSTDNSFEVNAPPNAMPLKTKYFILRCSVLKE